jgi:hypothetical protein
MLETEKSPAKKCKVLPLASEISLSLLSFVVDVENFKINPDI